MGHPGLPWQVGPQPELGMQWQGRSCASWNCSPWASQRRSQLSWNDGFLWRSKPAPVPVQKHIPVGPPRRFIGRRSRPSSSPLQETPQIQLAPAACLECLRWQDPVSEVSVLLHLLLLVTTPGPSNRVNDDPAFQPCVCGATASRLYRYLILRTFLVRPGMGRPKGPKAG